MQQSKFTVELWPIHNGAYTRVRMRGVIPTAVPKRDLRRLAHGMAFWSGYPIQCVLSVEAEATSWCEWWVEQLAAIHVRHLELVFEHKTTGVTGDEC